MSRLRHRALDESGAVLVLFGLLMTVMLGLAALLVDLGRQRATARDLQSVADFAALGGGKALSNEDPVKACRDAVTYVNTNASGLAPASFSPTGLCGQSGNNVANTACTVTGGPSQVRPSTTAGKYTLTLVYPVLAADIADSRIGGAGIGDGLACQRMGVQLTVQSSGLFSSILGRPKLHTTRMAVVRQTTTTSRRTPSLWLLDPTGCTSLKASGGSVLNVGTTSPVRTGVITIDSDGSNCGGSQYTISADGGTNIKAWPASGPDKGAIDLYGLPYRSTTCVGRACNPDDVTAGRISPQPTPMVHRATRSPVDWRYNCKALYPSFHGLTIDPCPLAGTTPPYVDLLRSAVGTSGQPAGFQRWRDTYTCNPAGTITVTGNWWIDCSALSIGNGTDITFSGGNIVVDGSIKLTGGSLNVNTANPVANMPSACLAPAVFTPCLTSSAQTGAFFFQRAGDFDMNGGATTFVRTTVIQQAGYLAATAGSPPFWSAPAEGPFRGLSLWSENPGSAGAGKYQINGGASMDLSGVFFTPEAAPFTINGGAPVAQQRAQFISYQVAVAGGASLTMAPDPVNFVAIPPRAGVLIR